MGNENLTVRELVDRAVSHTFSVPEFQRGFVWKPVQVRDLAESLWLDYPVGSILVWNSTDAVEERVAKDAMTEKLWIVDGQQRTTALCILFGRKPYWWKSAEDWEKTLKRYDIRFDIDAKEPPYFWTANAAIKKTKGDRYIPLSKILTLDTKREVDGKMMEKLATDIKSQDLCKGMNAMEVFTRLERLRGIREKELVKVTITHELEDVVEIFSRLNSRGTRVTEADIYLGIVAGRTPGWVREQFLPFHETLKDSGFDLNPNLLFRSLTGIAAGKTRFRDISDKVWDNETILPAWKKCQESWKNLVKRLSEYGVLSNDPMPTEAALVTLIGLVNKYPNESSFNLPFYWLLQASRYGRYSSSGSTSIDEDLKEIYDSSSMKDAVEKLLKRINRPIEVIQASDFMGDYNDSRFGRFLLYLLVYKNGARDWDEKGHRLGFEGNKILSDFKPQWHHIFPKKFLENKVDEEDVNALANIAVIGSEINIRIHSKDPLDYFDRYKIDAEKLKQQLVPIDRSEFKVDNYKGFLEKRSGILSEVANQYLNALMSKS